MMEERGLIAEVRRMRADWTTKAHSTIRFITYVQMRW